MRRAHDAAQRALASGSIQPKQRAEYVEAVRRYFAGFEREAREHLRDVDRRLEHLNQVRFNLTAERGVAVKRIEATREILAEVETMEHAP